MPPEPIACNLGAIPAAERPRYHALRAGIFRHVEDIRETADGFAFKLHDDGGTLVAVAEWITFERQCCPFLRFVVTVAATGPVGLELGGDAGVKDFLRLELGGALVTPERLVRAK
jgi:hypothetical protein